MHISKNTRAKFKCLVDDCNKIYLYVCTLKKHIASEHTTFYENLTAGQDETNFIHIYKDYIKTHLKGNFNEDALLAQAGEEISSAASELPRPRQKAGGDLPEAKQNFDASVNNPNLSKKTESQQNFANNNNVNFGANFNVNITPNFSYPQSLLLNNMYMQMCLQNLQLFNFIKNCENSVNFNGK